MWQQTKRGVKTIWSDAKYLQHLLSTKGFDKNNYSLEEARERRRISKDLFKFFPYALFMVTPGSGLVLPLYLLLFPNSVPTAFLSDETKREKEHLLVEDQRAALHKITMILYPQVAVDRAFGIDGLFAYPMDDPSFNLKQLTANELTYLCQVFCIEFIPGCRWVNILYSLFFKLPFYVCMHVARLFGSKSSSRFTDNSYCRRKIELGEGIQSSVKRLVLMVQLHSHIEHIRLQDRLLSKDLSQLERLSERDLVRIARERGLLRIQLNRLKSHLVNNWLKKSLNASNSNDYVALYAVRQNLIER